MNYLRAMSEYKLRIECGSDIIVYAPYGIVKKGEYIIEPGEIVCKIDRDLGYKLKKRMKNNMLIDRMHNYIMNELETGNEQRYQYLLIKLQQAYIIWKTVELYTYELGHVNKLNKCDMSAIKEIIYFANVIKILIYIELMDRKYDQLYHRRIGVGESIGIHKYFTEGPTQYRTDKQIETFNEIGITYSRRILTPWGEFLGSINILDGKAQYDRDICIASRLGLEHVYTETEGLNRMNEMYYSVRKTLDGDKLESIKLNEVNKRNRKESMKEWKAIRESVYKKVSDDLKESRINLS